MNQRNVDALFALLEGPGAPFDGNGSRELAEWLASRGVLVPAAITWEDWVSVVGGDEGNRDECVAALERIAKGD